MPMTSKQMIKLLKNNGFEVERVQGSHYIMKNHSNGKIVVVPYHSKDLPKGTENSILKQAGLK